MKASTCILLSMAILFSGCFQAERTNPLDPEGPGISNATIQAYAVSPVLVSPSGVVPNGTPTNEFILPGLSMSPGNNGSYMRRAIGKDFFVRCDFNGMGGAYLHLYALGGFTTPLRSSNVSVVNHNYPWMTLLEDGTNTRILYSSSTNVFTVLTPDLVPEGTVSLPGGMGLMPVLPSLRAYGNDLFILVGDRAFRMKRGVGGAPATLTWSNQLLYGKSFFTRDTIAWNGAGKVVVLQVESMEFPVVFVLDANTGALLSGPTTNIGGVRSTNHLWMERLDVSGVEGAQGTFLFVASKSAMSGDASVIPRFLDLPDGYGVATERFARPSFRSTSEVVHAKGGILFGAGGMLAQFWMNDSMSGVRLYRIQP